MNCVNDSLGQSHRSGAMIGRFKLLAFTTLVLAAGALFATVAGAPRLPINSLPSTSAVTALLSESNLPLEPLLITLVDLVWLLWIWIVASLCIEVLLVGADAVANGAAWVASARSFGDRVSMPLVRQAVAAALTLQVISRGVPIASAQTLAPPDIPLLVGSADHPHPVSEVDSESASRPPMYLVREGDTLWTISERAYGTGTAYRRIVEANVGQRMPDGQVFSARGVIQPGWQLRLPDARWNIEEIEGQRWYTVQPGDSLSSIAGSVLGNSARWQELFDLNSGSATPDGAHALADPDVIWPGLRLRLPGSPDSTPVADSHAATPDPDADPTPTVLVAAGATPDNTSSIPAGEAIASDLPPLLRTAHIWDPVALETSDIVAVEAPAGDTLPSAGDAEVSVPPSPARQEVPFMPLALGGLGLAAVAGLAVGARHVRRLRPLSRVPENDVVLDHGFAEAEPARDLTRGVHGIGFDPVAALVGQLQRFLAEYNLDDVQVVAVKHGHSSTTIALRCTLAQQPLLIDLAPVFAATLGAEAEAAVSIDQDVHLKLLELRRTRLLPTAKSATTSLCLVPLGVLYDKQIFSAAWDALGHILVVSLPGHGADTILTSLVATITARRSPEQLRIWTIAPPRALPAPLFDLPHLERVIDPAAETDLQRFADDLRAELDRRANRPAAQEPDLVVLISELSGLGAQAERLALLAAHAAELGVHFVAASSSPEDVVSSPFAPHFETRMVLRMQSEEISVALLGVADAADLSGGGRLSLRIDGRHPLELYGFHVSPEHLERLVKMMRSVYRASSDAGRSSQADDSRAYATQSDPPRAEPPSDDPSPADERLIDSPPTDATSHHSPPSLQDETTSVIQPVESQPSRPPSQSASPVVAVEGIRRPLIKVICFGGPRVLCAGQLVWPRPETGDAKPWEFLLYLACQPAEGVARDQAVDALWPEDELPEDAAHRFRQLRYRLRRMLSAVPGAPQTDGISFERGVLRLDPGIVYSDAHDFLDIVRRARVNPPHDLTRQLERARELFSGDLLEGPDARRYAWVDERDSNGITLREHFRRHFQQVSTRLAELYTAAGEHDLAIVLYRELTESDPGDERLWQALFRLHAKRGDRLALVREERRMRDALRLLADEIDAPEHAQIDGPSPETVKEFQRLLASLRDREPEPLTA